MTVTDCFMGKESLTAQAAVGALELGQNDSSLGSRTKILSTVSRLGSVCNAGEFDVATVNKPLESRKVFGDATDQAVLRFAESIGSVSKNRSDWKNVFSRSVQ